MIEIAVTDESIVRWDAEATACTRPVIYLRRWEPARRRWRRVAFQRKLLSQRRLEVWAAALEPRTSAEFSTWVVLCGLFREAGGAWGDLVRRSFDRVRYALDWIAPPRSCGFVFPPLPRPVPRIRVAAAKLKAMGWRT